jgi:FKBP-type peptidyl-prolyl cis-trans isomerase FkpA
MKIIFTYSIAACIFFALHSCGTDKPVEQPKTISKAQTDSLMIEMEKRYNQMEEDRIKNYISTHFPMEQAESGYWYTIRKKNPKGKEIKDMSLVRYTRVVGLCDATECYRDTMLLKVGNGNEIKGMHHALKMLREGEAATFIFPSYLAHGLLGDMNKVPPKSELIYEVEILEVQ